jgi:SIR2-like domain
VKLVLFAGAGSSAELGVPAMRQMSVEFRDHLRDSGYSTHTVESLSALLDNADFDMEAVIDDLDSATRGASASVRWGLGDADLADLVSVRAEAEWFVSHLCERVDAKLSGWLWGPLLRAATPETLTIATTNYDRAIELAAVRLNVPLADGFPQFVNDEMVSWSGFEAAGAGPIRLLKIHGSTDWYHRGDASAWKLRHAMPLFGNVRVSTEAAPDVQLNSALVLPSREKVVNQPPYPSLQYEFRKAVEQADIVAFVGTSLRDPDLRDVAAWSAGDRPTFTIRRTSAVDAPGVAIALSASRFLSSVLPRVLTAASIEDAASLIRSETGQTGPILGSVAQALDPASPVDHRCRAIDQLARERVVLLLADLEPLLRDPAEEVATYALGLIRDSPDASALTEIAQERARAADESSFAQEARLLAQLTGATGSA